MKRQRKKDGTLPSAQEVNPDKYELQKERLKLQAEKVELNKMLRETSRSELFEEKLLNAISSLRHIEVPKLIKHQKSETAAILTIADAHYGKELKIKGLFGEILNEYNVEIFEQRMWELLTYTIGILEKENLKHINIFNLGDSLDGILRISQLQSLQLGIVDSVIGFSDFMATWLNELSKYTRIDYYSTRGNHDEIRPLGSKRGDFPHENTERLVVHYLKKVLENNKNITIHDNNKICFTDVLGHKIMGLHGDAEKDLEKSLKDYSMIYGTPINLLLTGHLHHSNQRTVGVNVEIVQSPSLMGIDDYSISLKKTSNAGAKLLILEQGKGKTISYDIKLN